MSKKMSSKTIIGCLFIVDEEFMKDFLEFKESFEKEMGLDMISAISTDIASTAKKSLTKPKVC